MVSVMEGGLDHIFVSVSGRDGPFFFFFSILWSQYLNVAIIDSQLNIDWSRSRFKIFLNFVTFKGLYNLLPDQNYIQQSSTPNIKFAIKIDTI